MRDSKFRENIFKELREIHEFRNYSDRELNYKLFKHPAGNRLTFDGMRHLQKLYDSYDFPFDVIDSLSTRHLIALSREIQYPYYIGKSRLVLFSGEDAVVLKLYGNDIEQWLDSALENSKL